MAGTLSVQKIQGLASSAAPTTVEIASGHKLSGAAGSIVAPGHIIQCVNSTLAGGSDASTTQSYISTSNTLNITPKQSNSKIRVSFSHVIRITPGSNHTRADVRLRETTTNTTILEYLYFGEELTDGGKDPILPISGTGVFTTSNTSQKTFDLQFRKANGEANQATNIDYKWYTGATFTMDAMEIAQ